MEDYPEELRTPPMPLVALVGMPEHHPTISSYLHTEPLPINALALPDFSKVSVIGGKERKPVDARLPPPVGILKIDWLWKHRTRVPAAIVVLLSRDEVNGDPAQWLQVCTNLDNIKNVIRGRNIKLVVMVTQSTHLSGEIIDERLMALRKRADIEAKYFLTFISQEPSEQKRSLARLGSILGELVTTFYKEEGRRVKLRIEKKMFNSNELSARFNFKVAVYAEFRRDWVEALKFYEAAYNLLQEAHIVSSPIEVQSVQRLVELKTVAEQLHFKVSTFLLHGGKEIEAVKWFRQHINFYKGLAGPLEGHFLHWSWISKQFLVFGDLLQNSLAVTTPPKSSQSSLLGEPPVTDRELQPGYYYQVAARYMLERYHSFRATSSMSDVFEGEPMPDVLDGPPEEVGTPLYVGQAFRLLNRGSSFDAQCPTDPEYMYHVTLKEKTFPHSSAAISLLKKAYEQYKLTQAGRMVYYVASEMGREYFIAREYANAKQLLDSVAGLYRQEAWVALLWTTLGFLRECARQLQLLKEYVEYSLEMAALPTFPDLNGVDHGHEASFEREVGPAGPLCHSQREEVYNDVLGLLQGRRSVLPARDGETGLTVGASNSMVLDIDVASPLRAVLQVCVAFHEQVVKPGMAASLTLSLLTHLPQALVLKELELRFNQSCCNLVLQTTQVDSEHDGVQVKGGFDLILQPNKWKRFAIDVVPGQSGKLECLKVTAWLGQSSTLSCQVESPASREDTSLWRFESQVEMLPIKDSCLSCFGQRTIQVEEQDPLVGLFLEAMGPGLLGEFFPVAITIKSNGHAVYAGEVKVSIAEASNLSMISSPRTPNLGDHSLVQLYTMEPTSKQQDTPPVPVFQMFSGIMSVPSVSMGNSWSSVVYLKWKEAKPVSLYVSFSYQSELSSNEAIHPHRLFVHKGLQLDCEMPFSFIHRYMAPFRRDALILGGLEKGKGLEKVCIPVNETSILLSTLQCFSSVQLELLSVTMNEVNGGLCAITESRTTEFECKSDRFTHLMKQSSDNPSASQSVAISSGESLSKLFFVQPTEESSSLAVGTISLKWRRLNLERNMDGIIVTEHIPLPAVQVEKPPLLARFHCPPHGTLGVPICVSLSVENRTPLLQEVMYSIVDSPGFILSGSHSDSVHVLPYSTDVISCKLISIACGLQQLPQFNLTATRYSAGFKQSIPSIQFFVFPSTGSKQVYHTPQSNP